MSGLADGSGVDFLEGYRAGTPSALEHAYRAHLRGVARAVTSTLVRHGGHGGAASSSNAGSEVLDLVQDAFASAFEPRTRLRFDGVRDLGPYIGQIARNVVVDHLRRRRRRIVGDAAYLPYAIQVASANDAAADPFTDPRTLALVTRYIEGLAPDLRRLHRARYVDGLSQREAGAALGIGRQVVRRLESALLEGLRQALGEGEDLART